MSNKGTKIDRIKIELSEGDFLKFRNYRKDQIDIRRTYWKLICMILHSSRVTSQNNEYYSPTVFLEIVQRSFNNVFLDIEQTKINVKEIARQSGISRSYWEKNKPEIDQFSKQQVELMDKMSQKLYHSITTNLNTPSLIYRSGLQSTSIYVFDKWHKKLNQPISHFLEEHFPEELMKRSDNDIKLLHDISINEKLIIEFHNTATEMVEASYGVYLFEDVDRFFKKNPEISTYNEDLLV